jgi:hypothetical protein
MKNVHDRRFRRHGRICGTNRITKSGASTRWHGDGTGGIGARCPLLATPDGDLRVRSDAPSATMTGVTSNGPRHRAPSRRKPVTGKHLSIVR